jgi:glycerophosphoryl diester phosphodiesterase
VTINQLPLSDEPEIVLTTPKADLLDIVFNQDGTASDVSASAVPVTTLAGSAMMTYYNSVYERFVSHFNHEPGTTVSEGFYKADYSADQHFIDGLADGHTLEVLFKCDEQSTGESEWKMFSAMSSGGTGFLITKAERGTELTFLPNVSTTGKSNWIWTKSGITPEAGRYYHVVGVWNKSEGKSYIYVDGELKGTVAAVGDFVPPTKTTSYWFGVGVDSSPTTGQSAWKGDVAIARVYNDPLDADAVKSLWEAVRREQTPSTVEISDLLYLSGCEVGPQYRYTLYGKGFASGDKVRFETLTGSTSNLYDLAVTNDSATLVIPADFTSGTYRMILLRGTVEYPLGVTTLNFSTAPAALTKPQVIAHRGYHVDGASENSRASLSKAQALGVYGSEFDVWITTDGKLVVNHDKTLPNDSHVIEDTAYTDIQNVTLSNGEKVPTLDDFLDMVVASTSQTKLIIEIKNHTSSTNDQRAADAVVAAVQAKGLASRVEYIAFDYATCKRIAAAQPDAMVQYLNGDLAPASVAKDQIKGIDYKYSVLTGKPEWVKEAHNNNMVVNTWTVDAQQEMLNCIAMGVDFITTNNPDTLQALLEKTFVAAP